MGSCPFSIRRSMHKNRIEIWLCLAFALIHDFSEVTGAPQQISILDLGTYKVSVDTENGFAIRREINVDTPFFKLHKNGEIGFGSPVANRNDDDRNENSYENQLFRRKREVLDHISPSNGNLRRIKRSPCYGKRSKGYGRKGKSKHGRRRRQAEIEKFNGDAQNAGKNIGEHIDQAVQQIGSFWQIIAQATQQFAESIKKTFSAPPNGSSKPVNSDV